jgi:hypothetical protein
MGEYEDRYPEAYGHNEDIDPSDRHFGGIGLPRQVRGDLPADDRPRGNEAGPGETPPAPIVRAMHADMVRTPREICDDIWQQLDHSPFVDASGVTVSVADSEVTLEGTINSLIAISLAQSLAANVAGVSRVQVRLRVKPPHHAYEPEPVPVAKLD